MITRYHPCGYPINCPEGDEKSGAGEEYFDGHHPERGLTVCPACGDVLRIEDLQDYWDDLEFEVH